MNLIETKILVSVLFGIIRFIFGILPIKIYKILIHWEEDDETPNFINEKRHNQVRCGLALCQSFGGGVLFATCFLHMMPEVYKSVEDLKQFGGLTSDYPLSQLMISFGFFLIYFIEEISHWFLTKIKNCDESTPRNKVAPKPSVIIPTTPMSNKTLIIEDDEEKKEKKPNSVSVNSVNRPKSVDELSLNSKNLRMMSDDELLNGTADGELTVEEEVIEINVKNKQQIVRSSLIVLALSLHAIFEGLAIGLQTSTTNIWYLFIAISIHSSTILFCISLELLLVKTRIRTIIFHIFILAITSPFGVLIGLLITLKSNMNTKAKSTAIVFLEGISAGTILYIIFFEILNREKERRIYRLRRAICIICGFALMAILQSVEML